MPLYRFDTICMGLGQTVNILPFVALNQGSSHYLNIVSPFNIQNVKINNIRITRKKIHPVRLQTLKYSNNLNFIFVYGHECILQL